MKYARHAVAALFPLTLALAATPAVAHSGDVVVQNPWARASIGTSRPTAAFMTIVNKSQKPDRLVRVSTPSAGLVEIHKTELKNGRAMMKKTDGIAIPPGGTVMLKPGGYHIMLMKLKAPVVKGTTLPLTLTFEHAGTVKVDAMVMAPGSSGHMHH